MSTFEALAQRREEFRKYLYGNKERYCTLSDMVETDSGNKKVIFPRNGYEVEYKNQTFEISNSRDHENLHLTVPAKDEEEANRILANIENYSGEDFLSKADLGIRQNVREEGLYADIVRKYAENKKQPKRASESTQKQPEILSCIKESKFNRR